MYTMIDENNNNYKVNYKTARTFFKKHGGNSVLIVAPDGTEKKYRRYPDGTILEVKY